MTGYPRSSLARHLPRPQPTEEELSKMRQMAWQRQGVAVLRPEDIADDWARQVVINTANRLYGARKSP